MRFFSRVLAKIVATQTVPMHRDKIDGFRTKVFQTFKSLFRFNWYDSCKVEPFQDATPMFSD